MRLVPQRSILLRTSDVERIIENLENALRVHPDPVKHCEVHKEIGCTHVDGYLCDMETCDIRQKFLQKKNFEMLGEPQKIKIGEKEFDQVGLLSANAIHTAPH